MKKLNVIQIFNYVAWVCLIFLVALFFSPIRKALKQNAFVKHVISEQEDALYRTGGKTLYFIKPNFESLGRYVHLGESIGNLDSLLNYYSKAAYYFPDNADILYMYAFMTAEKGEYDQAIVYFKESQKLDKDLFWAHYNAGMLLFAKKDYVAAKLQFKQALDLYIKQTVERIYRSGVFHDLLQVTGFEPRDLLTHLQLHYENAQKGILLCYFYEGNYEELFEKSAALVREQEKTDSFYLFMMGASLIELQQYEIGLGILQSIAKGEDIFSETYNYLGKALKGLERNDLANDMSLQAHVLLSSDKVLDNQFLKDMVLF